MLEMEAEQFERDEEGVYPWDFCGPSSDSAETSTLHGHFIKQRTYWPCCVSLPVIYMHTSGFLPMAIFNT